MEPNKFEKEIQKKLNDRQIQPSSQAWDRLDAMLSVAEKPKRSNSWMYIAASFLGFILIATLFLTQTEEIIDAEINNVVLQNPNDINKKKQIPEIIVVANESSTSDSEKQQIKNQKSKILNGKNQIKTLVLQKSIINQKIEQINENEIASQNVLSPKKEVLSTTASEIYEAKKPKYVNAEALLASVESPLEAKQKEILFNQKSNIKVNPNSLLTQIDGELELSFREKVIKTVSKKFQTVKGSFANRNDQ